MAIYSLHDTVLVIEFIPGTDMDELLMKVVDDGAAGERHAIVFNAAKFDAVPPAYVRAQLVLEAVYAIDRFIERHYPER